MPTAPEELGENGEFVELDGCLGGTHLKCKLVAQRCNCGTRERVKITQVPRNVIQQNAAGQTAGVQSAAEVWQRGRQPRGLQLQEQRQINSLKGN